MSEHDTLPEQPEQTTEAAEVSDTSLTTAPENAPVAQDSEADAQDAPAESEEEEEIPPYAVRIFGMPRICFQLTAAGIGVGMILYGLAGILFHLESGSTLVWSLVCAAIGYFIGNHIFKTRQAAEKAAKEAAENTPQ